GDMYGFDVQRKGNIFHIYPAGLRTETIPVNYLMMSRRGLSRTSVSTGGVTANDSNNGSNNGSLDNSSNNSSTNSSSSSSSGSDNSNGTRIETDTNSDYWTDLRDSLQTLIGSGDGRAVITSPQAGLVTIRAYPKELKAVREFLTQSESHLKRQVVLEARIIEVALNEGYEQGVDWSGLSASWDGGKGITGGGSAANSQLPTTPNQIFSALGGGAGFKISDGNFNVAVNLLKTQGDVNTLSSPRVTATNNQKAVIKVGTDEYFVTNASTSTTTSTGAEPIVTPNVELTPFFSGIALDVTPQIDEEGRVLLHIHPSVIDTEEQKKIIKVGTAEPLELPLAKSSIRESDTVVQANNGDIIVIGGLMKTDKQEIVSKVPLLGDIPWIGEA
ncbi:pilus (MSHA type) biogenesis protein MshL, partial [Aeromonas sobria]